MELFQANNHSVSIINYKETDQNTQEELERILAKEYKITKVTSIAQVQEIEINSNNFRVITPQETYLLRRNKMEAEERVKKSHNIIAHCRKRGVPTPKITPRNGQAIVKGTNYLYTLFEFVDGHHFRGSIQELKELGKGIAKLHLALAEYNGEISESPAPAIRSYPPYSPKEFIKIKKAIESKKDEFQEESLKEINYIVETSKKVLSKIKNIRVRIQPIHLDLHPHNTLFVGNVLEAILDYDGCCKSELIRDIGYALHRAVRQYIVNQRPKDIKQEVKRGIKVFLETYEEINPLSQKERELIPSFIQDECLHRIHSLMSKHYLGQGTPWIKDLPKQLVLLKEGEYFKDD